MLSKLPKKLKIYNKFFLLNCNLKNIVILFSISTITSMSQDYLSENQISHRPPMFAGSFYPKNPNTLNSDLEKYLNLDEPQLIPDNVRIIGIISPHAGYIYSGFVAGKIYKELKGRNYKTAIIIAPSHQKYFNYASIYSGDAYVTPLGVCPVDKELAEKIASFKLNVKLSTDGHDWRKDSPEHSLEVQIPFLQKVLPNIKIVPIVMGSQDEIIVHCLSRAIINALKESQRAEEVILIASTDLSHYHSKEVANRIDNNFIKAFSRFDYFKLGSSTQYSEVEACGLGPVLTVMTVSENLGANKPIPIHYGTSGDSPYAPKMRDQVVGYFAGALAYDPNSQPKLLPKLTEDEKNELLSLAYKSIEDTILHKKTEQPEFQLIPKRLGDAYPLFVTIYKNDELRACMGHTIANKSLFFEVQDVARLSATSDWRFGRIAPEELPYLSVEITILSRFIKIFDLNKIQIGKHGLYLKYKNHSGLLLPQVASERNWDVETFLENLCFKAGVAKTTYLDPECQIYAFEALIIK